MAKNWSTDIGAQAAVESSSKPNTVLLVNLGREHEDTQEVKAALEAKGFKVEIISLRKDGPISIDSIKEVFPKDFSGVAAVDLRDCRGWQSEYDFFSSSLNELNEKVLKTGRDIPIINPPDMFKWIASKEYLRELNQREGIPIVDTVFLRRGSKDWPDIFAMMDENPDHRIVLKPAKGSHATDVIFITKRSEDAFEVTCPQPRSGNEQPKPHVITFTKDALNFYLKGYGQKHGVTYDQDHIIKPELLKMQNQVPMQEDPPYYKGTSNYERLLFLDQHQPAILIQPYTRGKEISAVFLGDKVRYVDRSADSENLVAHEDYGGQNISNTSPNHLVEALAKMVKDAVVDEALPPYLKMSLPYLRVDMLQEGNNPPALLEVEAGSARLFLKETGRIDEYAEMVERCVQRAEFRNELLGRLRTERGFASSH